VHLVGDPVGRVPGAVVGVRVVQEAPRGEPVVVGALVGLPVAVLQDFKIVWIRGVQCILHILVVHCIKWHPVQGKANWRAILAQLLGVNHHGRTCPGVCSGPFGYHPSVVLGLNAEAPGCVLCTGAQGAAAVVQGEAPHGVRGQAAGRDPQHVLVVALVALQRRAQARRGRGGEVVRVRAPGVAVLLPAVRGGGRPPRVHAPGDQVEGHAVVRRRGRQQLRAGQVALAGGGDQLGGAGHAVLGRVAHRRAEHLAVVTAQHVGRFRGGVVVVAVDAPAVAVPVALVQIAGQRTPTGVRPVDGVPIQSVAHLRGMARGAEGGGCLGGSRGGRVRGGELGGIHALGAVDHQLEVGELLLGHAVVDLLEDLPLVVPELPVLAAVLLCELQEAGLVEAVRGVLVVPEHLHGLVARGLVLGQQALHLDRVLVQLVQLPLAQHLADGRGQHAAQAVGVVRVLAQVGEAEVVAHAALAEVLRGVQAARGPHEALPGRVLHLRGVRGPALQALGVQRGNVKVAPGPHLGHGLKVGLRERAERVQAGVRLRQRHLGVPVVLLVPVVVVVVVDVLQLVRRVRLAPPDVGDHLRAGLVQGGPEFRHVAVDGVGHVGPHIVGEQAEEHVPDVAAGDRHLGLHVAEVGEAEVLGGLAGGQPLRQRLADHRVREELAGHDVHLGLFVRGQIIPGVHRRDGGRRGRLHRRGPHLVHVHHPAVLVVQEVAVVDDVVREEVVQEADGAVALHGREGVAPLALGVHAALGGVLAVAAHHLEVVHVLVVGVGHGALAGQGPLRDVPQVPLRGVHVLAVEGLLVHHPLALLRVGALLLEVHPVALVDLRGVQVQQGLQVVRPARDRRHLRHGLCARVRGDVEDEQLVRRGVGIDLDPCVLVLVRRAQVVDARAAALEEDVGPARGRHRPVVQLQLVAVLEVDAVARDQLGGAARHPHGQGPRPACIDLTKNNTDPRGQVEHRLVLAVHEPELRDVVGARGVRLPVVVARAVELPVIHRSVLVVRVGAGQHALPVDAQVAISFSFVLVH